MMAMVNGTKIFVKYKVAEKLLHARYLCGQNGPTSYFVLTLDGDVYEETLVGDDVAFYSVA